jgi:hypothetical protein
LITVTTELRRAQLFLNTDRAKEAMGIIFGAMDNGCTETRQFMVDAFKKVGYVDRLAELQADRLIMVNTDIDHWSRFRVSYQNGENVYGWHPQRLELAC